MRETAENAQTRVRIAILVGSLSVLVPSVAPAQLASTTDRKCIQSINDGTRKVALASTKQMRSCADAFRRGQLGSQTVAQCVAGSATVQKAVAKALIKADGACGGAPPSFGPPSISAQGSLTVQAATGLLHDLFGAVPENALSPSTSTVAACQGAVLKTSRKCTDVRLVSFNKCKKSGMSRGFATTAADLQNACLGTGAGQPDPTGGKITQQCVTVPAAQIDAKCAGVTLGQAFPGCPSNNGTELATCVDGRIRCRVCDLLNHVDGLARDCDVFDDGNDDNQSCVEQTGCGDGDIDGNEACDDGNNASGDGCSATCTFEPGWTCGGEPTACTPICGDGLLRGGEQCDDGGTTNGNGCDATCHVEPGYSCTGQPSVCSPGCGDGLIRGSEACDDHNLVAGDGCSPSCQLESGWSCSGEPTSCHTVCGDGLSRGTEQCDDGGTASGNGCSATCQLEPGWSCTGSPSVCVSVCGDGVIRGSEVCDDGAVQANDGCSVTCQVEPGWSCGGEPSSCTPICGDGIRRGAEQCDDGDATGGDGCDGSCEIEFGWSCVGQPSACTTVCGDGVITGAETCDDDSTASGDGCSATCQLESGWACEGEPSECAAVCGDGLLRADEQCDDGNGRVGDGCNPSCDIEPGYTCSGTPSVCQRFTVTITSPVHGTFTTASSVTVTGFVTNLPSANAFLTINGVQTSVAANGVFSRSVPLNATDVFNPIRATVTDLVHGSSAHARVVVIRGASIADGSFSPKSVALRVTDGGLDAVEPLVEDLAGSGLDLGALLPVGTVIVNNECFVDTPFGCAGHGTVTVIPPPPSIGGFSLAADSMTNFVAADITVSDIRVNVHLEGDGVVPDCDIHLTANAALLNGDYALEPLASDPTTIDVNQIGDLDVSFSGFQTSFDNICGSPVIGDIIQSFMPDVEQMTVDAMKNFLSDPDGSGPADSPTADAIETALAGVSITGPVGDALGVDFDAPLYAITEDNNGVTFGSDGRFTTSVGNGPGQCVPPAGAPNLSASLAVNEGTPTFGTTTPVQHLPYDIAISISTEGFNQLLRSQTECGLLVTSLTSLDLGTGPIPITAGLLTVLMPQFEVFPPATPFRIDIRPTLAPIILATPGPNNELAVLKMAQLLVTVVQNDGSNAIALQGAVDTTLGLNLAFASGALAFQLATPSADNVTVAVIENPLGVNVFTLENDVLPPLVAELVPDLAGSLASFPLPEFLGLTLQGVEVSRTGEFLSLYANLNTTP